MTEEIVSKSIEKEIKTAFLDYSMSVIVSRALPDVRDGLKPVHRRILYAMHMLKNHHNRPYLKSARIVGDVMGKYHPHGDSAIYEALVRMAQDFSMRYPMVDGQGNFGSVDGDSAAAMRYTESRMQELSEILLLDIDKETVDFVPNYDNKEVEPTVLPARLPQLLINGSSGIAVGMATNIPPHNLREVVGALKATIENPEISLPEIMQHLHGPDFPTKGVIVGTRGIQSAYATGRGSVIVRARAEIEEISSGRERILISEIPYQVNKAKLIERIAELVRGKKIEGISDLRDESAKNEIRVVVEVRRGDSAQVVLNNLYKMTAMQTTFGINLVALVRGLPKTLSIKDFLREFYFHRREVVLRRTAYLHRKNKEKAHLLEGLKKAVENLEEVVAIIKNAGSTPEASERLQGQFSLSQLQARAVLDMRLARLTGLERSKIVKDYEETMALVAELEDILARPERVTQIVVEELDEVCEKFGDSRRTEIQPQDLDDFSEEALVADEDVAITITNSGYVKRTSLSEIAAQRRGGKGRSGMQTRGDDFVQDVFVASNHQDLLCFTNRGRVFSLKVFRLPEANLRAKGRHFANLIRLEEGERVVSSLTSKEFGDGQFILSVTEKGFVKKTDAQAYAQIRASGIIGLRLEEGDELVSSLVGKQGDDVFIATRMGKVIRFSEEEIRSMGRNSRGVTGIRFTDEDRVIGAAVLDPESEGSVLSVCERGFGKRTDLSEYRRQSRGGKGIYTVKVTDRNGPVVGISQVGPSDEVVIMTSTGKIVRCPASEISLIGRMTQGVRLVSVASDERVISVGKVVADDAVGGAESE